MGDGDDVLNFIKDNDSMLSDQWWNEKNNSKKWLTTLTRVRQDSLCSVMKELLGYQSQMFCNISATWPPTYQTQGRVCIPPSQWFLVLSQRFTTSNFKHACVCHHRRTAVDPRRAWRQLPSYCQMSNFIHLLGIALCVVFPLVQKKTKSCLVNKFEEQRVWRMRSRQSGCVMALGLCHNVPSSSRLSAAPAAADELQKEQKKNKANWENPMNRSKIFLDEKREAESRTVPN